MDRAEDLVHRREREVEDSVLGGEAVLASFRPFGVEGLTPRIPNRHAVLVRIEGHNRVRVVVAETRNLGRSVVVAPISKPTIRP